uniref:Serine hydrolase domain-containing protein n=1 Tax=Eutreptiella gymnastica TaxID=73025 RepID=A0A7S1IPF6_9EUGL|mmetsp:Transcript_32643/g.58535  ORF Transcript_32643/g.58535 Transcript_32643/m.58535 type:complete len:420 (+) Transcript_32643:57-1316(+)
MLETILDVDGMHRKISRHGAPSAMATTRLHGAIAISCVTVLSYLSAELIFDRQSPQSSSMLVVTEPPQIEMASLHNHRLRPADAQPFATRQHRSHKDTQEVSKPSKKDTLAISGTFLTIGAVKVGDVRPKVDPVVFFMVSSLLFALGYMGKVTRMRCWGGRSTHPGFEVMEQRPPPVMTSTAMAFTTGMKASHGVETHVDASPATDPSTMANPYRILVLHGKEGNGDEFKERLAPLQKGLGEDRNLEWVFLTAPHAVGGGFAWWTLPPGVRSFQATEYGGFEESIELIERAWEELGPFDAVMGYSQGAILLSVLLSRGLTGGVTPVRPSRAILFGAAWPNPYSSGLEALKEPEVQQSLEEGPLRTLHVYGTRDKVNPPEMAKRIADLYGHGASHYEHAGGHIVPQTPEDVARYAAFLFP